MEIPGYYFDGKRYYKGVKKPEPKVLGPEPPDAGAPVKRRRLRLGQTSSLAGIQSFRSTVERSLFQNLRCKKTRKIDGYAICANFSPLKDTLWIGTNRQAVQLYTVEDLLSDHTGMDLCMWRNLPGSDVTSITTSPTGTTLYTCRDSFGVETSGNAASLSPNEHGFRCSAIDESTYAVGCDGKVLVGDTSRADVFSRFRIKYDHSKIGIDRHPAVLSVDVDANTVYAGTRNRKVCLLDSRSHAYAEGLETKSAVTTVKKLKNSYDMIVAQMEGHLTLYDTRFMSQPRLDYTGHVNSHRDLVGFGLHKSHKYFSVAGSDDVVRIWALENSDPLTQLEKRDMPCLPQFLDDNLFVASGRSLYIYDAKNA